MFEYVLGAIDKLLSEYAIDYLKWDMNRDLPSLLIKVVRVGISMCFAYMSYCINQKRITCFDRVLFFRWWADYGMLPYCERFWTSDNHDALGACMYPMIGCFFLPELLGAHVGPNPDSMTQRMQPLKFRALTAMFYHFGLECDLTKLSNTEQTELTQIVSFYKQWRHVFHQGHNFFLPTPSEGTCAYAVMHEEHVFVLVAQLTMLKNNTGFQLKLPMLTDTQSYCVDWSHII